MESQQMALNAASVCPDLDLFIEGERVSFSYGFNSGEDEPGDMAFDLACDIRDRLKAAGLTLSDWDADNDTIWGYIVPYPPQAQEE